MLLIVVSVFLIEANLICIFIPLVDGREMSVEQSPTQIRHREREQQAISDSKGQEHWDKAVTAALNSKEQEPLYRVASPPSQDTSSLDSLLQSALKAPHERIQATEYQYSPRSETPVVDMGKNLGYTLESQS
jgi:hypothetical protein